MWLCVILAGIPPIQTGAQMEIERNAFWDQVNRPDRPQSASTSIGDVKIVWSTYVLYCLYK